MERARRCAPRTAVFFGMLVTLFGLIFILVFYAAIQRLSHAPPGAVPVPAGE